MASANRMTIMTGQSADAARETWEARALRSATGVLGAVLMAVMFNKYAEKMPILLRATFPGFRDVKLPQFTGCATITKTGHVVCDMFDRSKKLLRNFPAYESEDALLRDFRGLADRLKLSDADRVAMTGMLKEWIVADLRINHMGEKVA